MSSETSNQKKQKLKEAFLKDPFIQKLILQYLVIKKTNLFLDASSFELVSTVVPLVNKYTGKTFYNDISKFNLHTERFVHDYFYSIQYKNLEKLYEKILPWITEAIPVPIFNENSFLSKTIIKKDSFYSSLFSEDDFRSLLTTEAVKYLKGKGYDLTLPLSEFDQLINENYEEPQEQNSIFSLRSSYLNFNWNYSRNHNYFYRQVNESIPVIELFLDFIGDSLNFTRLANATCNDNKGFSIKEACDAFIASIPFMDKGTPTETIIAEREVTLLFSSFCGGSMNALVSLILGKSPGYCDEEELSELIREVRQILQYEGEDLTCQ
jgi:hypothetical protein